MRVHRGLEIDELTGVERLDLRGRRQRRGREDELVSVFSAVHGTIRLAEHVVDGEGEGGDRGV